MQGAPVLCAKAHLQLTWSGAWQGSEQRAMRQLAVGARCACLFMLQVSAASTCLPVAARRKSAALTLAILHSGPFCGAHLKVWARRGHLLIIRCCRLAGRYSHITLSCVTSGCSSLFELLSRDNELAAGTFVGALTDLNAPSAPCRRYRADIACPQMLLLA